uniref:CPSF_A domain-containing protein n=1 Tax=Loa loa TaxID=7209 RepID=A0A1I7VC18_LOALO
INLADNFRTNNDCANSANNNLKSLVSFDPKSNILLRIHNHIDDDDDVDDDGDRNDKYFIILMLFNNIDNRQQQTTTTQQQQHQQQRISGQ